MSTPELGAIVAGAGIAGLAAALEFQQSSREILVVEAPVRGEDGENTGETQTVSSDQGPRASTAEGLAKLKAVRPDGMHTAGNSSQISDGSAAVLWMTEDRAKAAGLRPRARLKSL